MRVRSARDLGGAIRSARRAKQMTQLQVAEAAGVQRSWLARVEKGTENPTFAKLLSVFQALDLEFELEASVRPLQERVPDTSALVPLTGRPSLDLVLARLSDPVTRAAFAAVPKHASSPVKAKQTKPGGVAAQIAVMQKMAEVATTQALGAVAGRKPRRVQKRDPEQ